MWCIPDVNYSRQHDLQSVVSESARQAPARRIYVHKSTSTSSMINTPVDFAHAIVLGERKLCFIKHTKPRRDEASRRNVVGIQIDYVLLILQIRHVLPSRDLIRSTRSSSVLNQAWSHIHCDRRRSPNPDSQTSHSPNKIIG